jgi:two-component system, NtrC family, sensor kinase
MQKTAIICIIAILYAVAARLSFFLAAPDSIISPVWPPTGIALASMLIFGNIALIGIFIGCYIANSHMFMNNEFTLLSFLFMSVPAIGGAIQAYVGKVAILKFTGSKNIFQNTHSVLIFILLAAFGACLINATFGTSMLVLTYKVPVSGIPTAWLTWWIADAVGVVAIASTIIAWKEYWKIKISFTQITKLAITWMFILIAGYFTIKSNIELSYIFIPFAIWAAFQFDIRFSLLTGLLISAICLYNSSYQSHMMHTVSTNTSISLIQLFITIIYLTILLTYTILSDRQKAYLNLQLLILQLEQLVLDRTNALSESNKQLEIQKNKAIDALEALKYSHARLMQSEKMASLGMLTAGVAHEIKHPLNAMSANMDSIKQNMQQVAKFFELSKSDDCKRQDFNRLNENIASLITAAHEGIKRTAGVIADLCAFARSDEPEMVTTEINKNIDSTLNLLSSEIKGNVTIVKEYSDTPPLLCHPGKINQVLMNILVNAIHALQTKRDGKIIITTKHDENSLIISIKDNASGIKKEVLDKLFTPFTTTKQAGMGSGLGLFLSYNIIKEHRGTIKVQSEPSIGTEFIITLPIRKE